MIRLIFLVSIIIAIAAPFTFLKPHSLSSLDEKKLTTDAQHKKEMMALGKKSNQPQIPKVVEKPLHDVLLPNFAKITDIPTKKQKFFDFIKPAIIAENNRILTTRAKVEGWLEQTTLELGLTEQEELELLILVKKYRVKKSSSSLQQLNELLIRVDIIPLPLVLVQAANESAWGTSRFARIGLNFFGIWCYEPNCGMVPSGRNAGAKHEVAAFSSVEEAVSGYFKNINTHNAYRVFRTIRAQLRGNNEPFSPEILATGLLPYSERGADYVMDITDMLRHNKSFFINENEETYNTAFSE